ncbi:MAG: trimethylamine methyltransferase family protein [Candidatus Neomarinimicrobiota bacterium]
MRPTVEFLDQFMIQRIISEARTILIKLGIDVQNVQARKLLVDEGAQIKNGRIFYTDAMIDKSLDSALGQFDLYDIYGNKTHQFSEKEVYFTPGSAALNILDNKSGDLRKPTTSDYIQYVKIVEQLEHIASQSTAMIPGDIHEMISDSYRLFLSLLYGSKPVVTGTFTIESFDVMKDFQIIIRGSERELKEKPLTIFSCCPSSPLKWSDVTAQNVLDCAKYGIPVEFIAMPLAGFLSPVTLSGTLIQHTAETLSGLVISQLSNPGTPILYGGSPAIFDVRYETTPMGAIETMMIDCAYNEIGKYLGLPTQAYISLSDSKALDTQAGIESGIGAVLASLSGINNISGPGMLDFESCFSLEKLVADNEICGMTKRLIKGIEPRDDFPSLTLFTELLKEKHLLISDHTMKYLESEHYFTGPTVNRANRSRWQEEGAKSFKERAAQQVIDLTSKYQSNSLSDEKRSELIKRMEKEAQSHGQKSLPPRVEG